MELMEFSQLPESQQVEIRYIASKIGTGGAPETVIPQWEGFIQNTKASSEELTCGGINQLVQIVLQEAYSTQSADLVFMAEKVRYFDEQKQAIREQITTMREMADKFISDLEEQLATVGEDAQLANIDLQNMLQKQQQTMQLMSNMSKMMHDTAMAVVRKMG